MGVLKIDIISLPITPALQCSNTPKFIKIDIIVSSGRSLQYQIFPLHSANEKYIFQFPWLVGK